MLDVIFPRCAALQLKKHAVIACRSVHEAGTFRSETRTFTNTTEALQELGAWLDEAEIPMVVTLSNGDCWKPIYANMKGGFRLLLLDFHYFKDVKGRPPGLNEAEWLALLMHWGLLNTRVAPRHEPDLTRPKITRR